MPIVLYRSTFILSNLEIREAVRNNLLEFTRAAFRILPSVNKPSILDIGCGSGVQTIELAKMCNGHITAIDINVKALQKLREKVDKMGFSNRISIIKLSMMELKSLGEKFNIIWAEGSIYAIGFERGIREWKEFLVDNGFLVIHDQNAELTTKLDLIRKYGYTLIKQIDVSSEEWWKRYYEPLENLLSEDNSDSETSRDLRRGLDSFKKNKFGSVFFILQNSHDII